MLRCSLRLASRPCHAKYAQSNRVQTLSGSADVNGLPDAGLCYAHALQCHDSSWLLGALMQTSSTAGVCNKLALALLVRCCAT